ncbi:PD-(D/E)XK nuclease-like domain-containing protein [Clostridium perfringens]|uniref:PD-(D/E)XK nuclease-like domain-containing protein n=1 Tax=Clostridium perfringens TaxID=1502 RepID=UPI0009925D7A|nr:PD-(D/E)XK nuclease-like domain-containing protein [Clostridium perfringens]AQW23466.1 hypothetical protein BXT91_05950 [Clostridium perfringens]ATD48952.1 hypothetical protein CMR01_09215 [Clostridium perfringens]
MEINKDNYFSLEADREYFSVSQFKSFKECEAKTMAKLNGTCVDGTNDAFTLGSYVHLWSEGGNLGDFRMQHPEMFRKDGDLKANFKVADKMIETLSKDPLIEKVREGQKEVIFTGELYGAKWKIMIDIYNPSSKYFADLKTTRSIQMKYWNEELRVKQNFIEYYDYLLQMAVYAEIERQNRGGEDYLQPHIIAVSKEEIPDKAVILVGTEFIKDKLLEVEALLPHFIRVKNGEEVPTRCEHCDYCRSTKQISKIIHYTEL